MGGPGGHKEASEVALRWVSTDRRYVRGCLLVLAILRRWMYGQGRGYGGRIGRTSYNRGNFAVALAVG